MALQPLSQGPPVALVGPARQAGACAEEERGRRFDSQRGVEGSSRAGRAGAALLAWLTGRPHSGGVKL